ncbi:MAG: hypothetical protein GXP31_18985 [Kiritimatiellaeota bacterium]|nr:hypothetical protein [Kiritimatiellota bacterium]
MIEDMPNFEPSLVLTKYLATFERIPPPPGPEEEITIEEHDARMQRALDRGRPLRGWWDDGTENGDADERVPEGEEDFFVPVREREVKHLRRELRRMELREMPLRRRRLAVLTDLFRGGSGR